MGIQFMALCQLLYPQRILVPELLEFIGQIPNPLQYLSAKRPIANLRFVLFKNFPFLVYSQPILFAVLYDAVQELNGGVHQDWMDIFFFGETEDVGIYHKPLFAFMPFPAFGR